MISSHRKKKDPQENESSVDLDWNKQIKNETLELKESRDPGLTACLTDLFLDAVVTIPAHGGRYPVGLVRGRLNLRLLRWWLRLLRQQLRWRRLRLLLVLLQLQVLLQISHIFLALS